MSYNSMMLPTSKGEADVIVQHDGLSDRTGILQLEDRLLLYAEDDDVLAADPNLRPY
jgi:hypothetical protein